MNRGMTGIMYITYSVWMIPWTLCMKTYTYSLSFLQSLIWTKPLFFAVSSPSVFLFEPCWYCCVRNFEIELLFDLFGYVSCRIGRINFLAQALSILNHLIVVSFSEAETCVWIRIAVTGFASVSLSGLSMNQSHSLLHKGYGSTETTTGSFCLLFCFFLQEIIC